MKRSTRLKLERALEEVGRSDPRRYAFHAATWAALAEFLLSLPILLVWGITVPLMVVGGSLGTILILLAVVCGRNAMERYVAMKDAPPQLSRKRAPKLFELVDGFRARHKASRIDGVRIDSSFNAGIVNLPSIIPFWPASNILLVGLPLLEAMGEAQGRAVLGHEIGHLAHADGWLGAWIYGVYQRALAKHAEGAAGQTFVLTRLIWDWLLPRLHSRVQVLLKLHEIEADKVSAEMAGTTPAAEALLLLAVRGRQIERDGLPEFMRASLPNPLPPEGICAYLAQYVRRPHLRDASDLHDALRESALEGDPHPATVERLRSIGVGADQARLPALPATSAADAFFGERADLRKLVDEHWVRMARESGWEVQSEFFRERVTRLAELEARTASGAASADEAIELARALEEVRGQGASIPLLRRLLAGATEHIEARLMLGHVLSRANDPECEAHLEAVARKGSAMSVDALQELVAYSERSSSGRAAEFRARLEVLREEWEAAGAERENPDEETEFERHAFSPQSLAELRRVISVIPELRRAWLATQKVNLKKEFPHHVLVFEKTGIGDESYDPQWMATLMRLLERLHIGEGTGVLLIRSSLGAVPAARLDALPEALIYESESNMRTAAIDGAKLLVKGVVVLLGAAMVVLFSYDVAWGDSMTKLVGIGLLNLFTCLAMFYIVAPGRFTWALRGCAFIVAALMCWMAWIEPFGGSLSLVFIGIPALNYAVGKPFQRWLAGRFKDTE